MKQQVPTKSRRWILAAGLSATAGLVGAGLWYWQRQDSAVDASPRSVAVSRLAEGLRGNPAERRAVVAALDAVRQRALVPLIETALQDADPSIWGPAVLVAGAVGRPGDEGLLAQLTARAKTALGPMAVELALARRRLGVADASPALASVSTSPGASPDLRLRAAATLCELGELEPPLLRQLLTQLERSQVILGTGRSAALLALLAKKDADTEQQLLAQSADTSSERGLSALLILARAGRGTAIVKVNELVAQAPPGSDRELELLSALADLGDSISVHRLGELARTESARNRQRALAAIGRLGHRAEEASPLLESLLDHRERAIALTAAAALVAVHSDPETGAARRTSHGRA